MLLCVVLVPQEGFLFDDTIAANVRYGRLEATEAEILESAPGRSTDWTVPPRSPSSLLRMARH